ncbi:sortase [Patescibacteria group bacterium]|nr:sortase [Patescibacteria group bacterium]MCG2701920.1 sortase [Candidatus Parcubacteria bacterium]MBU4265185.1 sortase [Patescibacteria group bacterium]MBU4390749.1 sortase [Patescibacteria group bacterium]MBU4396976.1 sortase [Patescibacteria group bacterium]
MNILSMLFKFKIMEILEFFRVTPHKRKVKIKGKSGVIFSNPSGVKRHIFYVSNLLLVFLLFYAFYLYGPLVRVIFKYHFDKTNLNLQPKPTVKPITSVELQPTIREIKKIESFKIRIDKIGAVADVKVGVSPFDEKKFKEVLSEGWIVHAKGSALPGSGKGKMSYIFAHSTELGAGSVRKNSTFYLLGEMEDDDEIIVDIDGKEYVYRVYDKKVVEGGETEYLSYSDASRDVLILQTCWPIGTNWKRLLVFGELVNF